MPLSDDYFAANDAPLDEVDSPAKPSPSLKDSNDDPKTNVPVRRPIIVEDFSNIEIKDNFSGVLLSESPFITASKRQHLSDRSRGLLPQRTSNGFIIRPRQQSRWIALHTPTRIYIPVRYDGKDSSENVTDANCVQCSPNISVTAPRQTLEMLRSVFGEETLSRKTVFQWFKRFCEGRENVEDYRRTERRQMLKE
ncbi:uncharacterized protein TNCV_560361 [Trichonephila clavipes]|nr:uncharacterized protein TNCV_560361 [Trichonephila clavipes]